MSTMIETIKAFNDLDYDVIEWNSSSVTIKSAHDYEASLITIHRSMYNLTPEWVKEHLVDRATPYMRANYNSNWTRSI